MSVSEENEKDLVELMALIYGKIPWSKINTSKNAWDIWNHRVRAASTRGTIGEFASRLANHFSIQSLPVECVPIIDRLTPCAQPILNLVYREHIPIAMRAVIRAKERKEEKKHESSLFDQGNTGSAESDPTRG